MRADLVTLGGLSLVETSKTGGLRPSALLEARRACDYSRPYHLCHVRRIRNPDTPNTESPRHDEP